MRQTTKGIITLAVAMMLAQISAPVWATAAMGPFQAAIDVDGQRFQVWGYGGDLWPWPLRLRDIAYILNGTSAQFDVRVPDDNRWDIWIETGVPYTLTGRELQAISYNRHAVFGSQNSFLYFSSYGFDQNPFQTITLGIGRAGIPTTSVVIEVFNDGYDIFIDLEILGNMLGFTVAAAIFDAGEADFIITTRAR